MRIGIDATAMPPQRVGAGNYILNLVKFLAEADQNDYIIFAKHQDVALFQAMHNHRSIVPSASASRVGRILWEQVILPMEIRRWRIDVFHSPHYTMPIIAKCKSVVTFHDMTFFLYPHMHQAYKRLFFKLAIQLSARRANAIIADSESSRQDVINILNVDPHRVFTVPLGVAPHFRPIDQPAALARIRQKYRLPEQMILYVGVLEPRKNLPTLIRAFKSLVERGSAYKLVIAGRKGWMYDGLFRTINKLDLVNRVIFTGYVPEEELPLIYHAADLVVYPSVYEGFGLPVLEAMACGVPVITSNVSSMPEIVGNAGILVNPYRPEELAEAMYQILENADRRQHYAQQGLARAKDFSWARTARETLAVYQYAMQSK